VALINAARHAHAPAVRVQLSMRDNQVHIVVADNGDSYPFRGCYDLAALTERKLGPVSLQERIVSLGGGLTIDSTESGSRLEITLPLKHDWFPWDAQASDSASGHNACELE
jgi:signal transduction histidine kinase